MSSKNISPFYHPPVAGHFRTPRAFKYSTTPNRLFPGFLPGRPQKTFIRHLVVLQFYSTSDFCNAICLLVLNNSQSYGIPRILNTALISVLCFFMRCIGILIFYVGVRLCVTGTAVSNGPVFCPRYEV